MTHCATEVQRHDPDRFLASLFAPPERRNDLHVLYAFNLEVAKTREVVTERTLGEIRLQWWRDALAGAYAGTPPAHAVAAPLAEIIHRHDLSRRHFERLLDAREQDLDDEGPPDLAALQAYAEGTSGALTLLALEVLGATEAEAAGRRVGVAWALTGLLRAVPLHAAADRLYLPLDRLGEAGLEGHGGRDLVPSPAVSGVVREVAEAAAAELAEARAGPVPAAALPALLTATIADTYLARLRRVGFDPFAQPARPRGPGTLLRLYWNARRGRF